jgi:hypothetical protein
MSRRAWTSGSNREAESTDAPPRVREGIVEVVASGAMETESILPIRLVANPVGDNGRGWIPEAFRRPFRSFSGFSRMTQPVRDIWSICAGSPSQKEAIGRGLAGAAGYFGAGSQTR